MYVGPDGKLTGGSLIGPLAPAVPSAVSGLAEALSKWGTMPLREVLAPAIRLAAEGFVVDTGLSSSLEDGKYRIGSFSGKSTFFPNGKTPQPGERLIQKQLALTLQLIAREQRRVSEATHKAQGPVRHRAGRNWSLRTRIRDSRTRRCLPTTAR